MNDKKSKKLDIPDESLHAPGEELLGLEDVIKPNDNLEKEYGMEEDVECEDEVVYSHAEEEEEDAFENYESGHGNVRYYVGRWLDKMEKLENLSNIEPQDKKLMNQLVELVNRFS